MPSLMRTPEQIFRAERRDIVVIHSTEDEYEGPGIAPGLRMIAEWLKNEFPEIKIERISVSEYSGWIVGGDGGGRLRVDFGPDELKRLGVCRILCKRTVGRKLPNCPEPQ